MSDFGSELIADEICQTVNEINLRAEQLKISPMEVVEHIVDGTIPDVKPPVKKKLSGFVDTIQILRKHANDVRTYLYLFWRCDAEASRLRASRLPG